jgi:hypothetical protein
LGRPEALLLDTIANLAVGVGRGTTELYKVPLALAAALLALCWGILSPIRRRQALATLAILGCFNYARWGTETLFGRVDTYDLVHYYLNSKYFDELGYFDLYPAVILVDHENGGPRFLEPPVYLAQDASGHHLAPIAHALARGAEVKQTAFTPERWAAFAHDTLVLQREITGFDRDKKLWSEMIQDHGFNGTTAWTAVAEPIAARVPVSAIKWLGFIDLGLLAGAVGLVGWAYGLDAALWTTLFLVVTYSTRWPTITWAFLRYDWIAALIAATALLRRGWHLPAGLLAGWSAASRMFPALWMWGPFAKGVSLLLGRRVERPLLVLGGACLLGVALAEGAAVARFGTEPIVTHFENMEDHNSAEQLSSRRIGLALALTHSGSLEPKLLTPERRDAIAEQAPLRYTLAALWLAAVGWALRNRRDDEAFGFGFAPFFLLTTASYYYYVARATLAVVHAGDLERFRNRALLALLFGLEAFSNGAETAYPGYRMFLVGGLAWGLTAYALLLGGWLAVEAWRDRPDAPSPRSSTRPQRAKRPKQPKPA